MKGPRVSAFISYRQHPSECTHVSVFVSVDSSAVVCAGVSSHMDDEYKWAGVEDPKVMVTTSRDPSSRLKMFSKVRPLSLRCVAQLGQQMHTEMYCVGLSFTSNLKKRNVFVEVS